MGIPSDQITAERQSGALSYSITSSACASSAGETAKPNERAVLRLTTSSNVVGCSTTLRRD
jgi:hypothetical protein